jgi:hypothetical protein
MPNKGIDRVHLYTFMPATMNAASPSANAMDYQTMLIHLTATVSPTMLEMPGRMVLMTDQ